MVIKGITQKTYIIDQLKAGDLASAKVELTLRFVVPMGFFLLSIFGGCLGWRIKNVTLLIAMITASLISIAFYFFTNLAFAAAINGKVSIFPAVWTADILFFFLVLNQYYFIKNEEHQKI